MKVLVLVGILVLAVTAIEEHASTETQLEADNVIQNRPKLLTVFRTAEGVAWLWGMMLTYFGMNELCLATKTSTEYRITRVPLGMIKDLLEKHHQFTLQFPIVIEARLHASTDVTDTATVYTQYPPSLQESICNTLVPLQYGMASAPVPLTPEKVCRLPTKDGLTDQGSRNLFIWSVVDYLVEMQRLQTVDPEFSNAKDISPGDVWISEDVFWPNSRAKWKELLHVDEKQFPKHMAYAKEALRLRANNPGLFHDRFALPKFMRPKAAFCQSKAYGYTVLGALFFAVRLAISWSW
jgi:hypothetical protein